MFWNHWKLEVGNWNLRDLGHVGNPGGPCEDHHSEVRTPVADNGFQYDGGDASSTGFSRDGVAARALRNKIARLDSGDGPGHGN